jgi:hypothetical protein
MTTVRDTLSKALAAGFNARAKAAGFRKTRLNFERTLGATTQLIGFQLSKANLGARGGFFVNFGIVLDSLPLARVNASVAGKPVHVAYRGEELAEGALSYCEIDEKSDPIAVGAQLVAALEPALQRLERIDSGAALLRELGLDRGFERELRARIEYALGDYDAALQDLRLLVAKFGDRGMTLESLIESNRLDELILRL